MDPRLLPLLVTTDAAALDGVLHPDVAFHSPFADYRGRADVAHLFTLIAGLLDDVATDRTVASEQETVTFFTARIGGQPAEGVLDERYDAGGRVTEVTLMLRPFATLKVALAKMGHALGAAPLPSTRR